MVGGKAVPKRVYSNDHPIKLWVNRWLAGIARDTFRKRAADEHEVQHWVFLLETAALHTVRALLEAHVLKSYETVVIPNPDSVECKKIAAQGPGVIVEPVTSHELIDAIENIVKKKARGPNASAGPTDAPKNDLAHKLLVHNWKGKFNFVWLDYCGTLTSRAGYVHRVNVQVNVLGRLTLKQEFVHKTCYQTSLPLLNVSFTRL